MQLGVNTKASVPKSSPGCVSVVWSARQASLQPCDDLQGWTWTEHFAVAGTPPWANSRRQGGASDEQIHAQTGFQEGAGALHPKCSHR